MNNTLYVTTDESGLGRRENPYSLNECKHWKDDTYCAFGDNECSCVLFDKFNNDNSPLPTYSQNNELILNERLEVYAKPENQSREIERLPWQHLPDDDVELAKICGYQTRRIYRQVAIKEENRTEEYYCQKCNNPNELCTCLSSAQPNIDEHDVCFDADEMVGDGRSSAQPVKEGGVDEQFEADVKHSFKCWNTGLGLVVSGLVKSLADKGITLAKQQPVTLASKEVKSAEEMVLKYRKNSAVFLTQREHLELIKVLETYHAQFAQREGMVEVEATAETECSEFRRMLSRLSTQINNGSIELTDDSRDTLNALINTIRPFFNPLVRKK